jgi:putative DNA primase/helicase
MSGSNQNPIAIPERGPVPIIDTCGANGHSADPIVDATDPSSLARSFVALNGWRLRRYEKDWRRWDGAKYVLIDEEHIKADLWKWLEGQWPLVPTPKIVRDVLEALKYIRKLPHGVQMPCWIGQGDFPKPDDIIAFENGVIDVREYVATGLPKLHPHTARWFSATCLPVSLDPHAECPRWLEFLDQVFEGDEERVRALARWFGYNLTSDTSQQKFALLVGVPASGKSTTLRILRGILGDDNIVTPTLTTLWRFYGLETFLGKTAALVGDAHLERPSMATAILERIKSIVGNDRQNVDRKGQGELSNIQIKTRFTIAVNEMPPFPDTAAALRRRMIVFPFNVSFEGKEDRGLEGKLLAELPGITNWAMRGLLDLRREGRLLSPAAGEATVEEYTRYCSPIREFVEDCCEVGPDHKVPCETLRAAWVQWCHANGYKPGNTTTFGLGLKSVDPRITRVRHGRVGRRQIRYYEGIGLSPLSPH